MKAEEVAGAVVGSVAGVVLIGGTLPPLKQPVTQPALNPHGMKTSRENFSRPSGGLRRFRWGQLLRVLSDQVFTTHGPHVNFVEAG